VISGSTKEFGDVRPKKRFGMSDDGNDVPLSEVRKKKKSFHRGDTVNYTPAREEFASATFLQDYLLKGWMPAAPFVTRGTKITAFGSCFATNITKHLLGLGYDLASRREPNIYISSISDGMVNTAAILGQFEWALENKQQPVDLWHGFKAEGFGYDEDIRVRTRDVFLTTEFFIITLGLSEVWYDEQTGGTFWRAVPEEAFDASRHKFRVQSMEETKAHIAEIHRLIRNYVPDAKILFTVSPIPLAATFRPVGNLSANAVSKAIIRAALDEFLRGQPEELNSTLFYFPSMEIFQLGFVDPWSADTRHPQGYVIEAIMQAFEASYCVGERSLEDANRIFQLYRTLNLQQIEKAPPMSAADAQALRLAEDARKTNARERPPIEVRSKLDRRERDRGGDDANAEARAARVEKRVALRQARKDLRKNAKARERARDA